MVVKKLGIKVVAGILVFATLIGVTLANVTGSKANIKDSYQWSFVEGREEAHLCTDILYDNMDKMSTMTEEEILALVSSKEYSRQFDEMLMNIFNDTSMIVYRGEGDGDALPVEEEEQGKLKAKFKEIKANIDEFVDKVIQKIPAPLKKFFSNKLKDTLKNLILDFCDAYEHDNSFQGAKEKIDEMSKNSNIPVEIIKLGVDLIVDLAQTFINRPEGMMDINNCEISIDEVNNVSIKYDGQDMKDSNYKQKYEDSFVYRKATSEEISNYPSILVELAENMKSKKQNDAEFEKLKKLNPEAKKENHIYEKYILKKYEKWTFQGKNEFYGIKFIEKTRPATDEEFNKYNTIK